MLKKKRELSMILIHNNQCFIWCQVILNNMTFKQVGDSFVWFLLSSTLHMLFIFYWTCLVALDLAFNDFSSQFERQTKIKAVIKTINCNRMNPSNDHHHMYSKHNVYIDTLCNILTCTHFLWFVWMITKLGRHILATKQVNWCCMININIFILNPLLLLKLIKNCYTLYYIFLLIYIPNRSVAFSRHIFESIFKYISIYILCMCIASNFLCSFL